MPWGWFCHEWPIPGTLPGLHPCPGWSAHLSGAIECLRSWKCTCDTLMQCNLAWHDYCWSRAYCLYMHASRSFSSYVCICVLTLSSGLFCHLIKEPMGWMQWGFKLPKPLSWNSLSHPWHCQYGMEDFVVELVEHVSMMFTSSTFTDGSTFTGKCLGIKMDACTQTWTSLHQAVQALRIHHLAPPRLSDRALWIDYVPEHSPKLQMTLYRKYLQALPSLTLRPVYLGPWGPAHRWQHW